jgi:hypothetical protein
MQAVNGGGCVSLWRLVRSTEPGQGKRCGRNTGMLETAWFSPRTPLSTQLGGMSSTRRFASRQRSARRAARRCIFCAFEFYESDHRGHHIGIS